MAKIASIRKTNYTVLRRNLARGAAGIIIVTAVVLAAIFAEQISPHDPYAQNIAGRLTAPFWIDGNANHLLGTDSLGRDILSRVIYGSRISILVGLLAVGLAAISGVFMGLISGYFGGKADSVIMRLADIQLAVPNIVLALTVMAVLGPSITNIILVLALDGWVVFARTIRSQLLSVKELDFVAASQALGARHARVIWQHILPNVTSSLIVVGSLRFGTMILVEASLSFLGLGIQPPTPTWGAMIAEGRDLVYSAWWVSAFPGIAIAVTVLGMNLLGDWLRDTLDPRLRT